MALLLKNLLFTLLVPGTVAVLVPLWLAGGGAPADGARAAAASALQGFGAALYAWCVWGFARFGRGTPLPLDAPRRLVAHGPYRVVRNPMYVAVLAVIAGHALRHGTPALLAYGALVAICFQLFVAGYEEPHLRRRFGAEYEAYAARVGRWLPRSRRL